MTYSRMSEPVLASSSAIWSAGIVAGSVGIVVVRPFWPLVSALRWLLSEFLEVVAGTSCLLRSHNRYPQELV